MALSGDGRTLVAGDDFRDFYKGAVRVWSRSPNGNWTWVTTFRGSKPNTGLGQTVAVSYDGRTIASGVYNPKSFSGEAQVWGLSARGTWVNQVPRDNEFRPSSGYQPLVLSGDGSTMAMSISESRGTGVTVWKRTNGTWARQTKLFVENSKYLDVGVTLAISRDGRTLVAGSSGGVFIWRLSSTGVWDLKRPLLKGNSFDGLSVALSGDGRTLAATGGRKVRVWKYTNRGTWVQKGQVYPPLRSQALFWTLKLSSNGQILATCVYTGVADELPENVQIKRLSGNGTWVSLGSELIRAAGAEPTFDFGSVMALSGDGLTLAIGHEHAKTRGVYTGEVYVFTAGA